MKILYVASPQLGPNAIFSQDSSVPVDLFFLIVDVDNFCQIYYIYLHAEYETFLSFY